MTKDYPGVDIQILNERVSLAVLTRTELILVVNSYWKDIYGNKVIYE